jgi:hypothetical protein
MKFRNECEEIQKANHRRESVWEKKVGVTWSTAEGSGRIWRGSEETKEEKENKNK